MTSSAASSAANAPASASLQFDPHPLINYYISNGDSDADDDWDLVGFARLQNCFGSDDAAYACAPFDFSSDDAVELTDFAAFHGGLTGPR